MNKEQLLEELSSISAKESQLPWWQKDLLDEFSKSTCDTPRPISRKPVKAASQPETGDDQANR